MSATKRQPPASASKTKRPAAPEDAAAGYWERRFHSADFRRALTVLVAEEITALAGAKVKHVLSSRAARQLLERRAPHVANRESLAELVLRAQAVIAKRLAAKRVSVRGLFEPRMTSIIDAMIEEHLVFSKSMENFIADLMRQEFVQGLFTDIIFTSIVSFNERVNPLFGRLAMGMIEDQIRSFIGLFMPMVQKQAVAFAVDRRNQAVLFASIRAMARRLLEEPLPDYLAMLPVGQRRKMDELVQRALADSKLDALVGDLSLAVWDEVYEAIQDWKVGDLLHLEAHASWLAERLVDLVLPALNRPSMLRLIADEAGRAR